MQKIISIVIAAAIVILLTSVPAYAADSSEQSLNAMEQTISRLLFREAYDAVLEHFGEPRQFWRDRILSVRKSAKTPFYEVVMQVETFCGAHNPPYGIETMTFYISYGKTELIKYEHQDEPSDRPVSFCT